MSTPLVGLDVGTSGVKAVAIDLDGRVLAVAEEGYPLSTPQAGFAEQDPAWWWEAAQRALTRVPAGPIGLTGQMHGLVALDGDGHVLRPAILWNDVRTGKECAEIEQRVGLGRLIELTGNRALAGFTAPKLLWLRRHEPQTYARIAHVLLPKDYVTYRLTGELVSDLSDASGTLLLDVRARAWSEELCSELEIPLEWLPRLEESTRLGGAGDCSAAAVGVGVDRPGRLALTLGTSGVVFAVTPGYEPDSEARVHTFCFSAPGTWHAMGVMLSGAGSLAWLDEVLGVEPGMLEDEARRWPPGCEGLLFAPYLAGERTPYSDPDARGAFTGLSLRHDRGALTRAAMEGVAFGLRDCRELLDRPGVAIESARIGGGGSRSRLWVEIVAAVLGVAVERTECDHGSAFGAALLAGVREGRFADLGDAVARCVRVAERVEPDPDWARAYAVDYPRFRRLYPTLRALRGDISAV